MLYGKLRRLAQFSLFVLSIGNAQAQLTQDYAIQISATVQQAPPQITLDWINNGNGLQYLIQRKGKLDTQWSQLSLLPASATEFIDTDVSPGSSYEYSITQYPLQAWPASGYILAGIQAPLIDFRGRVILIVDNTYEADLSDALAQLQQDLVGDGWTVVRHDVSPDDTPPGVKALIQNDYYNDPVNTRAVFLFGHVPVPRSGDYNADDHADHTGAWVADTYYGDMDGVWTDNSVWDTSAARQANWNYFGDGKFDTSVLPADLKLEVGRVDLSNMPTFLPKTEKDLLLAYLNKDHAFRQGMISPQRRGLIFDGFGPSGGQAYAASGWRNFAPFFSPQNITTVGWNQFLPTIQTQDYLWSYAASGGDPDYTDCYGLGQTSDFAAAGIQTIFMMFFGSYFGDWDAPDDLMRATLCSGTALTVAWAGRPHWFFHPMALGETIGYCTKLSQNNSGLYLPTNYCREVHISSLGDPTLRMHIVPPPSGLSAIANSSSVSLGWSASPDPAVQGYHVYRASSPDGPFTRVTSDPQGNLAFTDTPGVGNWTYVVRAIKLETSASGSYFNSSQGVFQSITVSPPLGPLIISNPRSGGGQFVFDCAGSAGQSFVIEQSTDLITWNPVLTNTMPATGFSAQFSPTATPTFYRLRTP